MREWARIFINAWSFAYDFKDKVQMIDQREAELLGVTE